MKARIRTMTLSLPCLAAALAGAAGAARASDDSPWNLVRGVTGQNAKKPAEVLHAKEDGTSNTLTNAALLWRQSPLPSGDNFANTWGLSLGFSKNTLSKKPTELLTAGANFRSVLAVSASKRDNITFNADYLLEDDRQHHGRGQALVLDATLRSQALHLLDPDLNPGQQGVDVWLYPSVGWFKRRVSSTSSPADSPIGSHGGAYMGLTMNTGLYALSKDLELFNRISIDASIVHARESTVSGGYSKGTYRYGSISVNYLLYGDAKSKAWKPMISFTRSKGTDRVNNEPHVDQSQIAFKVSYGI